MPHCYNRRFTATTLYKLPVFSSVIKKNPDLIIRICAVLYFGS
jgi:hypothetical protein